MAQLVRLQLSETSGSKIQAQVVVSERERDANSSGSVVTGYLPSPEEVVHCYQDWRAAYLKLGGGEDSGDGDIGTKGEHSRIIVPHSTVEYGTGEADKDIIKNARKNAANNSYTNRFQACETKAKKVVSQLNDWLRSGEFVRVRDILVNALQGSVTPTTEKQDMQFVICTDITALQQLPWTLWDLLAQYPHVEAAISSQTYQALPADRHFPAVLDPAVPTKVNVLAILGDSEGIDITSDRAFLETLPQAKVDFLVTPRRAELHDQLWNQPRDILFFAGHSRSQGNTGTLRLNAEEELSLDDIQHALERVARRGLTLAIFNSCDGLGLAKHLAQAIVPAGVPYIIVMREAVPDAVAQTFLKYFLAAFSSGEAFHMAVRSARERLENAAEELPPYGEWMPVIWQNPLAQPPVWPKEALQEAITADAATPSFKKRLLTAGSISAFVTTGVVGLRFLGALEGLELDAFDRMMRSRPADGIDQNILVVQITEEEEDSTSKFSIDNAQLEQLLSKIYQEEPHVVGLDLFRDGLEVESTQAQLQSYFADADNLITICSTPDLNTGDEIPPSPAANPEGVSFSELSSDNQDLTARRHLLAADAQTGQCSTDLALSTLVAYNYFQKVQPNFPEEWSTNSLIWGNLHIPFLRPHQGGYHRQALKGSSILLNYRVSVTPGKDPFEVVTMSEVLAGEVPTTQIKDRIVLIGRRSVTDDKHRTPLKTEDGRSRKLNGVIIHAHLVSQLIDAFNGDRKLIKPWPQVIDVAWIWLWAASGSVMLIVLSRPSVAPSHGSALALTSGGVIAILYGNCWIGLVWGGIWVPLVPSAIAFVASAAGYRLFSAKQSEKQIEK